MNVYRSATVISRLHEMQPKSAQEILDKCELPLLYIGAGAFRDAYLVVGTDLVIKVPRWRRNKNTRLRNITHAKDEYTIWKRIKRSSRKYNALQKYLPEILYISHRTGVIVMRRYGKVRYSKEVNNLIRELEADITKVMKTKEADVHYGNLGTDANGEIKIIDMGLFVVGEL